MLNPQPISDEEELVDFDLFCALVQDGQKADLIDGVIYMASPDSIHANDVTAFLLALLRHYLSKRKIKGKVFVNRVAFRISEFHAPEPDVAYVRPERLEFLYEGGMRGGPDIAVEVVAKESRDRDYHLKRNLYEQAGVSEYWIVDYLQQKVEFLRLVNGKYEAVPLEENRIFRSAVIAGFWLDVEWLLARSLPDDGECLEMILK